MIRLWICKENFDSLWRMCKMKAQLKTCAEKKAFSGPGKSRQG